MSIRELKLTKEQHDWVNGWLELWGAWVYSGRLDKRQSSVIAQYMATVTPPQYPNRPMCNDDDGMLISQVVDSVMCIDTKAMCILLSYYAHGSSKRAIASYYHNAARPRKIDRGRYGEGWRKPSYGTCRNEIEDILTASIWMIYHPLRRAFIDRKSIAKVQHLSKKTVDIF
ncbi:antiterminator Q family protein [Serratia symbiotica]|uniref:Antiterminator n=1 Tax=Serratia symbiotica TaxID=138074 RepID=A0A7D5SLN1_9GAMM|nr:antiterminator Q family protein [Serratia symbiotica]QLH63196.1 antiterminator [Serratia symbiotica]